MKWIAMALLTCAFLFGGPTLARADSPLANLPSVPDRDPARLRLGLELGASAGTGDLKTTGGTLALRIGMQPNSSWALYYQARLLLAGHLSPDAGTLVSGFQSAALAEWSPGRSFLVGLGPTLDIVSVKDCACALEGLAFGTELRGMYRLKGPDQGRLGGGRRSGVMLSLAYHPSIGLRGGVHHQGIIGIAIELY